MRRPSATAHCWATSGGNTATELPATPLSARARPRSRHLAERRRNVSANDHLAFGRPATEWVLPKPICFGDAETGKESNVYGDMCSEHVPFRYLFSAKRTRIAPQFPPCWGSRVARDNHPSLQALRRAAKGRVEEYGHLPACDATVGAYDAKNGVPCD
jgi:hypothetical protein